ncbi:MAG: glycoside hydrolase family 95 protein [Chitinophagaceae bacterium]|nr:glycoside hydrolase family 95 protein [Chitinophagaceae bacterium]
MYLLTRLKAKTIITKAAVGTIVCIAWIISANAQPAYQSRLWYDEPAGASVKDNPNGWVDDAEWLKALPVGNGFIGAMVFGDVNKERLQLNEKTLWSGSPDDNNNPEAAKYIPQIRELLYAGKYKEATALTNKTQVCKGAGSGHGNGANVPFGCFQTLGDLWFDFGKKTPYSNYYRELDLIKGIALTKYLQDGVNYTREVFASYPDNALVIRFTADKPAALSFSLSLDRPEKFATTTDGKRLIMSGVLANGKGGDGMRYKVYAIPMLTGGRLSAHGNQLKITGANAVTILVTAATNHRLHYPDYTDENFETRLNAITKKTVSKSFALLRQKHVQDFSSFMLRNTLQLGDADITQIPTNKLLEKNHSTKNEQALYALYYQYGRYLLLSSSRKGSLPANLQGIWANKIQTPWNGDYHTDINVQMNYWPAEVTNLSDCHLQLADLVHSLVKPGTKTAKVQYNMNGWCLHPITNVWGYTSPGERAGWGMHVGATAWFCQHLWEHYAFTRDKAFLQQSWPVLKEACRFYFDWLVKDPVSGKWVSGPAVSPENSFIAPDGSTAQISMGPSHDQQVVYDLFSNTLRAAKILGSGDKAFLDSLQQVSSQLARPSIGSDGRLMEWMQEFKETEPRHRHVSHLFALFPGNEISFYKTPALAAAAKKSLEARGDGGNGWSLAWKIAFWARLHNGDSSLKLLNNLLRPTTMIEKGHDNLGGSYYNLFDACPPFQIDGNFGATAGIAEMLLQSHEDFIELLPALPAAWKEGEVKGLCSRGGFIIDMKWENSRIVAAALTSKKGGPCEVKYGEKQARLQTKAGQHYDLMKLLEL